MKKPKANVMSTLQVSFIRNGVKYKYGQRPARVYPPQRRPDAEERYLTDVLSAIAAERESEKAHLSKIAKGPRRRLSQWEGTKERKEAEVCYMEWRTAKCKTKTTHGKLWESTLKGFATECIKLIEKKTRTMVTTDQLLRSILPKKRRDELDRMQRNGATLS